jgi:hypothetical protein
VLCRESYGKRVFTRQPECTVFIDSGASGRRCAEGRWLRDGRDTVMRLLGGASRGRRNRLVRQAPCGLELVRSSRSHQAAPYCLVAEPIANYQAHLRQLSCVCGLPTTILTAIFIIARVFLPRAVRAVYVPGNHPAFLPSSFLHTTLAHVFTITEALLYNQILVVSRASPET